MQTFRYTAHNSGTGETVHSNVQAVDEASAAQLITAQGLVPLDIRAQDKGAGLLARFTSRVVTKDKVLFSRQLSTLINAGLPLVQALRAVRDQTVSRPLREVLDQVINAVEGGSALSVALARFPKVFNNIYVSLVAAGETSGTLDVALERLAIQQEKDSDAIGKIKGAMIYPLIILVVMIAVLTFMILKVLPQVESLYSSMPGAQLPGITRALLSLSNFVKHFWWLVIIIVIVLVFGMRAWIRTREGRSVLDSFYLRAPAIKNLFAKLYMARFTRTASTLSASGVPMLQMLDVVAQSISNVHVEASIRAAAEKVKGGKGLAESIENDRNFLPLVPSMIKIGETSGSLDQMLAKAADYYEKELDNEIKNIQTIIEPVMMVLMGIVAFIIVAAVLLPIYGLANQSGLGG